MKRIYLVLTTLFLFTGMAWADDYVLPRSKAYVEWNASMLTWDATTATITFGKEDGDTWGNGALGWAFGYSTENNIQDSPINFSAYNALVVKLADASGSDIEVGVCEDGYWDDDRYLTTSISAGTTCDTISLTARTGDYSQLDLSSINLIFLRTAWTKSQTIKLDSVYLTNLSDAQYSLLSPDVEEDFNNSKVGWNEESLTWDAGSGTIDFYAMANYYTVNGKTGTDKDSTSYVVTQSANSEYKVGDSIYYYYAINANKDTVFTSSNSTYTKQDSLYHDQYDGGEAYGNGAVFWEINITETDTTYISDLSGYDSLVVKLAEASDTTVEVTVSQLGYWDDKIQCQKTISTGNTELHINLNECTTGDGSMLNRDSINLVFIRTNWVANQTIKIDEIYVVNVGDTIKNSNNNDTIINANTKKYIYTRYDGSLSQSKTSGGYGTICLPYDATTSEATIYDVVGYGATTDNDNNETPSCLYLEKVSSMEAGKAYVYKSTTDSIVNFTLTGVANEPADAATGNALVGNIATDSVAVGQDDYILTTSNSSYVWGKGTGNYVRRYKAYLDLDVLKGEESSEETTAEAKGWIRMSIAGDGSDDTTGIKEIETEEQKESVIDDDAIYNLSGVRVTNPQKGIYIKNGKKYIIK